MSALDPEQPPAAGQSASYALAALAHGDLKRWHGLPRPCPRHVVDAAFGQPEQNDGHAGVLAGQPLFFRLYRAPVIAPLGITVWNDDDDHAVIIEIPRPQLAAELRELLGEPEGTAASRLGSGRTQLIYASRGLVAHVTNITAELFWLYAFEPTTVETYLAAPLSRVAAERIPRNR